MRESKAIKVPLGKRESVAGMASVVGATVGGLVVAEAAERGAEVSRMGDGARCGRDISGSGLKARARSGVAGAGMWVGVVLAVSLAGWLALAQEVVSPGMALEFGGPASGSYVGLGNPGALSITGAITLEAWFRTSEPDIGDCRALVSKWHTAGVNASYALGWNGGGPGLSFHLNSSTNVTIAASSNALWNDGKWHHVAGTWNGSTIRILVDGTEMQASDQVFGEIATTDLEARIGSDATGAGDRFFDGCIDEVRVWGVARTQDQLRDGMHRGLDGDEPGLVAYYRFDDASGQTLADQTAHGLDGALHGMTDASWVASTAPVPFFTVAAGGDWMAADTWPSEQGTPTSPWSRVRLCGPVSLSTDVTVTDLELASSSQGLWLFGTPLLTISGALALGDGRVVLGWGNLLLDQSASVTGDTGVVEPNDTGELRRAFAGTGLFTFPAGAGLCPPERTPVTVQFTSGTFAPAAYVGVRCFSRKHPQNTSTDDYVERFWSLSSSGITAFVCETTFYYSAGHDVVGTEADLVGGKLSYVNSQFVWTNLGAANPVTHRFGGTVTSFSDFTAGENSAMTPAYGFEGSAQVAPDGEVIICWRVDFEEYVTGYRVEREATPGAGWQTIGSVLAAGSDTPGASYSVYDPVPVPGAVYRVVVSDLTGVTQTFAIPAVDAGDAVTFYLALVPGWNLVSLPCLASVESVAGLRAASTGSLWGWIGGRYVEIDRPAPLQGLWLFATTTGEVQVTGTRLANRQISLVAGWNLFGPAENALVPAGLTVFAWDEACRQVLAGAKPGLLQTHAYWIHSDTNQRVSLP